MTQDCPRNFSRDEIISGLRSGRTLRVDRLDAPELPEIQEMERWGWVTTKLIEVDEQYSYLKVQWNPENNPYPEKRE